MGTNINIYLESLDGLPLPASEPARNNTKNHNGSSSSTGITDKQGGTGSTAGNSVASALARLKRRTAVLLTVTNMDNKLQRRSATRLVRACACTHVVHACMRWCNRAWGSTHCVHGAVRVRRAPCVCATVHSLRGRGVCVGCAHTLASGEGVGCTRFDMHAPVHHASCIMHASVLHVWGLIRL